MKLIKQMQSVFSRFFKADRNQNLLSESKEPQAESDSAESAVSDNEFPIEKKSFIRRFGPVRLAFFCIFSCIFAVSLFVTVRKLISYRQASNIYDNLRYQFYHATESTREDIPTAEKNSKSPVALSLSAKRRQIQTGITVSQDDERFAAAKTRLEYLKTLNDDMFGWISISYNNNIIVDLPVAQGSNNDEYLIRAFEGTYNPSGSIFADFRNSDDIKQNRNTVLYGHNMADDTMFSFLLRFKSEDVFRNAKITLSTLHGIYEYEVFSAFACPADFQYFVTSFADDREFTEFLTQMKGMSLHSSNVSLRASDHILTLSTCTNTVNNYRFAVQAKLISVTDDGSSLQNTETTP